MLLQIEFGSLKHVIDFSPWSVFYGSPSLKSSNVGSRIEKFCFLCSVLCFHGIIFIYELRLKGFSFCFSPVSLCGLVYGYQRGFTQKVWISCAVYEWQPFYTFFAVPEYCVWKVTSSCVLRKETEDDTFKINICSYVLISCNWLTFESKLLCF